MTNLNDILGESCIFKATAPHGDRCKDCTGRQVYAEAINCYDYLSKTTHKQMSSYIAIKIRLQQIRDANDRGVIWWKIKHF